MPAEDDAQTLSDIVDQITHAGDGEDRVSMREIMASVGERSFGPLLLVPGLIVLSPLGGVPGVPSIGAIVVFLFAVQILFGRDYFWMPAFILRREVTRKRMAQAGRFLGWLAHWTDKIVKPRWLFLVRSPFNRVIAATCVGIALAMPPLEVIPFANSATSAAISMFGLALVTRDGVVAAIAFVLSGVSVYFLIDGLLF